MSRLNLIPTAEQIKSIRNEKECGLYEAKSIAHKKLLLNAIDSATTVDELKQILTFLVQHVKIS